MTPFSTRTMAQLVATTWVAASMAACAQPAPVQNIDPARHGNLAAAQSFVREAYDKVSDAQSANRAQLGGHAARAAPGERRDQACGDLRQRRRCSGRTRDNRAGGRRLRRPDVCLAGRRLELVVPPVLRMGVAPRDLGLASGLVLTSAVVH